MQGLNYCHSLKIAHRDLKPENFLLLTKDDNSPLKIIDFGLSKEYKPEDKMTTRAGTPYYISPEVLMGKYDESCDIWSAGVILYILLTGMPPFYGDSDLEILNRVKAGKYDLEIPELEHVSKKAKDLISKMIAPVNRRLTAK